MPSLRKPKTDPAALYVCIEGHVSKQGSYTPGTKYRGDDPGVRALPSHFALADASDEEIHVAKSALRLAALREPVAPASPRVRIVGEIAIEHRVRAKLNLYQLVPPRSGVVLPVTPGHIYDAREVKQYPADWFEKVAA